MKAYIKGCGNALEVEVKRRTISECGLVWILDDCGVVYETHLCNVIFVRGEENGEKET